MRFAARQKTDSRAGHFISHYLSGCDPAFNAAHHGYGMHKNSYFPIRGITPAAAFPPATVSTFPQGATTAHKNNRLRIRGYGRRLKNTRTGVK